MLIRIPTPDRPQSILSLHEDLTALNRLAMRGLGNGTRLIQAILPAQDSGFLLFVHVYRLIDGQRRLECTFNRNGRCGVFTHQFDLDGVAFPTVIAVQRSWDETVGEIITATNDLITEAFVHLQRVHAATEPVSVVWPH